MTSGKKCVIIKSQSKRDLQPQIDCDLHKKSSWINFYA
nr:MAG TPA: hypothetical protein [Siphoviridae sp. ctngg6]